MDNEYTLYETYETHDVDYSWGESSTTERGYRLVLLIKDGNVSFEYQSGTVEGQDRNIEWEECDAFDVDMQDLDASVFLMIGKDIHELTLANKLKTADSMYKKAIGYAA